jgi:hypothetical protein
MDLKPMKTIKFGPESPNTYEVTDAYTRDKLVVLENKLSLKLDKSIIKPSNPTSTTIGVVGQTYINSVTESVFICIKADTTNRVYIWKDILEVDLSNYYTKEEVDNKISSVYNFKGSVQTHNDLPSTAENGDVYNIIDTGMNYAWTGTEWDSLGIDIDLSTYYTKTEVDEIIEQGKTEINEQLKDINKDISNLQDRCKETESNITVLNDIKADKETTYTKEEVDDAFSKKEDIAHINELLDTKSNKSEVYTKEEVDKIISSLDTSTTYIFEQTEPSSEWFIQHNLNKYPYVITVDLNGEEFFGDKIYIDSNSLKILFTTKTVGKAYLN